MAQAGPFDLILADPPYNRGWIDRLLTGLPAGALTPGGRLVLESAPAEAPAEDAVGWRLLKQRRYGDSTVSILARFSETRSD